MLTFFWGLFFEGFFKKYFLIIMLTTEFDMLVGHSSCSLKITLHTNTRFQNQILRKCVTLFCRWQTFHLHITIPMLTSMEWRWIIKTKRLSFKCNNYYYYSTEELPEAPSATVLQIFLQQLTCPKLSEYYLRLLLNSSAHLQLPLQLWREAAHFTSTERQK